MTPRRGREGGVLVVVLLLLLGSTLLAHAAFVLSRHQLRVARIGRERLRATLVAEAGLASVRDSASAGPGVLDSLVQRWDQETVSTASVLPLGRETFLLRSRGRTTASPVPVVRAELAWRLDPVERVASVRGVVEAAFPGGSGDAGAWSTSPPVPDSLACRQFLERLSERSPAPPPPGDLHIRTDTVTLGRWTLSELLDAAPIRVDTDVVTPGPLEAGDRCLDDPVNWGRATGPGSACTGRFPLIGAPGELEMKGGEGQGILVVGGALSLTDGARFRGVVLAEASVTIEDGARVEGWVRTGGALSLAGGGRVVGSACAMGLALEAVPVLRRVRPMEPDRRLILP